MSCDRQMRQDANGEVIPSPYFPDIIIIIIIIIIMSSYRCRMDNSCIPVNYSNRTIC
jgi:hypothetical protein